MAISDKAKLFAMNCFGCFLGCIGFIGLLVILSALSGCASTSSIQAVSDVCTFGDVQAYQSVTRDQKVAFVCK